MWPGNLRARPDSIYNPKMIHKVLVVAAWATVALIVFATLSPLGLRPHLTEDPGFERFAAFAAAGFLLGLSYPRRFLQVVIFLIVFAAGLEALQHLTPDRHGHLSDMSVKAAGGLTGVFVAGLVLRFSRLRDHG
ncbi:hypothetical protein BH10PSE10_BH10PSE10_01170 [soil metagenome]